MAEDYSNPKKELTLDDIWNWLKNKRQERLDVKYPPPPKPVPDDCDHEWVKWRDLPGQQFKVTRPVIKAGEKSSDSVIGGFQIQQRECHVCGAKEQRKYGWGDYE